MNGIQTEKIDSLVGIQFNELPHYVGYQDDAKGSIRIEMEREQAKELYKQLSDEFDP